MTHAEMQAWYHWALPCSQADVISAAHFAMEYWKGLGLSDAQATAAATAEAELAVICRTWPDPLDEILQRRERSA